MASYITSATAPIAAAVTNAAELGLQIYSDIVGFPGLVKFFDPKVTIATIGGANPVVVFDTAITEEHSSSATVTKFPVESGADITDHIVLSPRQLNITGVVSDTPIHNMDALIAELATVAVSGIAGPLGVVAAGIAAFALLSPGADSPSRQAFAALHRLMRGPWQQSSDMETGPAPFIVQTKLGTHRNMVITDLSVPRAADTGDALIFTIKLSQITIVAPKTVNLKVTTAALSAVKKAAGKQEAKAQLGRFLPGEIAGVADAAALIP